jgi:hypothetical protein
VKSASSGGKVQIAWMWSGSSTKSSIRNVIQIARSLYRLAQDVDLVHKTAAAAIKQIGGEEPAPAETKARR